AVTALAGWFVVDRWTGSFAAGAVAGSLLAFNAHLLTRLPHLQAAHAWGLPLVFYFNDRLLTLDAAHERDEQRLVVLLAVTIAAGAAPARYLLFFSAGVLGRAGALFPRNGRGRGRAAGAGPIGP